MFRKNTAIVRPQAAEGEAGLALNIVAFNSLATPKINNP
jgi:hypothetical protein